MVRRATLPFFLSTLMLWGSSTLAAQPGGEQNLSLRLELMSWMTRALASDSGKTESFLPAYGFLTARGWNLGGSGVFGEVHGYLAGELLGANREIVRSGDLVLGFTGWRDPKGRFETRGGRLIVYSGGAWPAYVDGSMVRGRPLSWLVLEAHGGREVRDAFGSPSGPVFGGRVALDRYEIGTFGVAFQERMHDSETAHRLLASDFALRVWQPLRLRGTAAYDLKAEDLEEAQLHASVQPHPWVFVGLHGGLRDPAARLPLFSIYRAFVAGTDASAGGSVDFVPPGRLEGGASFEQIMAESGPGGHRGSLRARLRVDEEGLYRLGCEAVRLKNGERGYHELRFYVEARVLPALRVSASTDHYFYLEEIRGYERSHLADATVRWAFYEGLELGLDVQGWVNPDFEQQGLVMVHLRGDQELL
jgi:hypothetical protein